MQSSKQRILCVDDDGDTRFLLENYLLSSDFEAVAVNDINDAFLLMEEEQFSLYILDGELPGVSGLSICEEIRRIDQNTPIIIFSGRAYAADIVAGMRAGANAYVVKPDLRDLLPTVKRLLEEVRAG